MKTLIITILLTISTLSFSQNDAQCYIYNTGLNGVVCGIGSAIHKKNNESIQKAFLNGFYKGVIGGSINFLSKKSTILVEKNIANNWIPKIGHSIGMSIVDNAILNKKIFSEYSLDLGVVKLKTNFKSINYYIHPYSIISTSIFFIRGDKLNIKNSIKSGVFCFTHSKYKNAWGFAIGDVVSLYNKDYALKVYDYDKDGPLYEAIANNMRKTFVHELIHTYQFQEYSSYFNLTPLNFKLKHIELDVPINDIIYLCGFECGFENESRYYSKQ